MTNIKRERVEIARRLAEARLRAKVSFEEAAEAADVLPSAVEAWEKGRAMPCLEEFRALLTLYGVMACDILFERNPFQLQREEAIELTRATRGLSPGLQTKVDLLLAILTKGETMPARGLTGSP